MQGYNSASGRIEFAPFSGAGGEGNHSVYELEGIIRYRHHIFVCVNRRPEGHPKGCCAARGSEKLREFFKLEISKRGLKGQVRANNAGCLDVCEFGPSVVVYPEGIWYTVATEQDAVEILDRHIGRGEVVERLLMPPVAGPGINSHRAGEARQAGSRREGADDLPDSASSKGRS